MSTFQAPRNDLSNFPDLVNLAKRSYSITMVIDAGFFNALGFPVNLVNSNESLTPRPFSTSLPNPISISPAFETITPSNDTRPAVVVNTPSLISPKIEKSEVGEFYENGFNVENLSKLGFPLNDQYTSYENATVINGSTGGLLNENKTSNLGRVKNTPILRNHQSALGYISNRVYVFKKVRFLDL